MVHLVGAPLVHTLVHAQDPLTTPSLTVLTLMMATATTAGTVGGDRKLREDGEKRGKEA